MNNYDWINQINEKFGKNGEKMMIKDEKMDKKNGLDGWMVGWLDGWMSIQSWIDFSMFID